jgi:hypothetical protein
MKPSELKASTGQYAPPSRKLKFPVDEKAEPPISIDEALAANGANCVRHGGLIGQRGEKGGMVFLCLPCKKYWRYVKAAWPSKRPLNYPRGGYL